MTERFSRWATVIATTAGKWQTFVVMLGIVLVWAVSGPLFMFSETWQLVINTGTTIITFLMVFLIQNTQNRDSMAVHLKLDEIIRAIDAANDDLIDAEDDNDEELAELKKQYVEISHQLGVEPAAEITSSEGSKRNSSARSSTKASATSKKPTTRTTTARKPAASSRTRKPSTSG